MDLLPESQVEVGEVISYSPGQSDFVGVLVVSFDVKRVGLQAWHRSAYVVLHSVGLAFAFDIEGSSPGWISFREKVGLDLRQ